MATQLGLLRSKLAKIEKELDKNRTSVIDDGWQTSKYAKKSRKWDVLAQEKMRIKGMIEDLELEMQQDVYACVACGAINEIECVCSENLED